VVAELGEAGLRATGEGFRLAPALGRGSRSAPAGASSASLGRSNVKGEVSRERPPPWKIPNSRLSVGMDHGAATLRRPLRRRVVRCRQVVRAMECALDLTRLRRRCHESAAVPHNAGRPCCPLRADDEPGGPLPRAAACEPDVWLHAAQRTRLSWRGVRGGPKELLPPAPPR